VYKTSQMAFHSTASIDTAQWPKCHPAAGERDVRRVEKYVNMPKEAFGQPPKSEAAAWFGTVFAAAVLERVGADLYCNAVAIRNFTTCAMSLGLNQDHKRWSNRRFANVGHVRLVAMVQS